MNEGIILCMHAEKWCNTSAARAKRIVISNELKVDERVIAETKTEFRERICVKQTFL